MNKKFCRGFTYYVDSSSISSLEIGTLRHPYRSLNAAFIEITNFHSNKNTTINLMIKERTTNYVIRNSLKVINIERLIINTYS